MPLRCPLATRCRHRRRLVLVTGYLDFLSYVELVIVAETSRNIVWREDQRKTDRTFKNFTRFGGKMKDDRQNTYIYPDRRQCKILDFTQISDFSYDAYVTRIANLIEIQDLPRQRVSGRSVTASFGHYEVSGTTYVVPDLHATIGHVDPELSCLCRQNSLVDKISTTYFPTYIYSSGNTCM